MNVVLVAKAFAVISVLAGIALFGWACIRASKSNESGDL